MEIVKTLENAIDITKTDTTIITIYRDSHFNQTMPEYVLFKTPEEISDFESKNPCADSRCCVFKNGQWLRLNGLSLFGAFVYQYEYQPGHLHEFAFVNQESVDTFESLLQKAKSDITTDEDLVILLEEYKTMQKHANSITHIHGVWNLSDVSYLRELSQNGHWLPAEEVILDYDWAFREMDREN